jgi:hypothetical protein
MQQATVSYTAFWPATPPGTGAGSIAGEATKRSKPRLGASHAEFSLETN